MNIGSIIRFPNLVVFGNNGLNLIAKSTHRTKMLSEHKDSYLQYAFLLGEYAPLILRAVVRREEASAGKPLIDILAEDELCSHNMFKSPDLWTISECTDVILHFFGHYLTRHERLEVSFIAKCRHELSHRSAKSFSDNELKRVTSDLLLSLLLLSAQTSHELYEMYQHLLTDFWNIDRQQLLASVSQCTEYENSLLTNIEKHANLEEIATEDDEAKETVVDAERAIRKMKESLTKAVLHGIDFGQFIIVDGCLETHGHDEVMVTKAYLVLLNVFNDTISGVYQQARQNVIGIGSENIYRSARSLVDILQSVNGIQVKEVVYTNACLALRMSCPGVRTLKQLLKKVESSEFTAALEYVSSLMKLEYDVSVTSKDKFLAGNHTIVDGTLDAQLLGFGTYKDLSCKCGRDQPIVSFCQDHEEFCCHLCAIKDHRSCLGLNKTTENEHCEILQEWEYAIRLEEDHDVCWINGCCIMPNGDVLLTDENNLCLKRMTRNGILSRVDLPIVPTDVCKIGKDLAAVGLKGNGIQLVNTNLDLELASIIDTDHPSLGLVSNGKLLYVTDGNSVYTYKTDGSEKRVLYRCHDDKICFSKLAISDDNQTLYIVNGCGGLDTIDTKGNHLYTLKADDLKISRGIGLVGDGTVLVCEYDNDTILRIDEEGKRILGTVLSNVEGVQRPCTLGFDRSLSKLVVGMREKGTISVLKLKINPVCSLFL